MEYVGWKDLRSAVRYLEAIDPFLTYRAGNLESVNKLIRKA
ncbi:hypothetical protein L1274_001134 [Duganella sp. HSC-15S17]|uniref:Uncharacterized protein n=1 Tax=Duganella violaceipulchra TaxID=2849652 RepID=A0ABT1GEQ4_9BURK|nr:hypothetical protein [Duganella violaceicalia]